MCSESEKTKKEKEKERNQKINMCFLFIDMYFIELTNYLPNMFSKAQKII